MKYDDASWHYGGDFPADLPDVAGATHIGMFVAWAMCNDLAGLIHIEQYPDDLKSLRGRNITPGSWLISICDEKFIDEDLNEEGNQFAIAYFYGDHPRPKYIYDYMQEFLEHDNVYTVEDSWDSFDRISPIISQRFERWKEKLIEAEEFSEAEFEEDEPVLPWWKRIFR